MNLENIYIRLKNKLREVRVKSYGRVRGTDKLAPLGTVINEIKLKYGIEQFIFRVDSIGDRSVIGQVFNMLDYEVGQWKQGKAFQRYYENKSKEASMLIIDAGANIGAASVYFNHMYAEAKLIAIEPEKANCELLRMNTKHRPVDVIEGAIGANSGKMYLQDPGLSDYGFRVGSVGKYEVQVFTMDQIISEYGENHSPLLLKIDIEGGETGLFERNCDWLNQFPLVIIELHDWMLPGGKVSSGFYRNISALDFDVIQRGENTFCFNNKLLAPYD